MLKYESEIRSILLDILNLRDLERAGEREDLRQYGLDSLNCIEVIAAIENELQITIPDEKLGLRYMHSIYDICKLIEEAENNGLLQAV